MKLLFNTGIFWGIIIILFGVNILLRTIFNINIPFSRILIGILIILFGISFILGSKPTTKNNSSVFNSAKFDTTDIKNNYKTIFGNSIIDLSELSDTNEINKTIKVKNVFSSTIIYVSPELNLNIKGSSAFGMISFPDLNNIYFGSTNKIIDKNSSDILSIDIDNVFGRVSILYK